MDITVVADSEELLRRIPADSTHYRSGEAGCKLTSTAFNDPARQPSVDRRILRTSLEACRLADSDGLVCLVAAEVRALGIAQTDGKGNATDRFHNIDVIHRPIPANSSENLSENAAHSQVEAEPSLSGSRFNKLKEALARLAEKRGWIIEPTR